MTIRPYNIISGLALLVLLAGCKHDLYQPPDSPVAAASEVCFSSEILPIFQSSCAKSGCHDVASAEDGYVLDSYDNIMKNKEGIVKGNPGSSKIYKVITDTDPNDRMPEPPNPALTKAQTDKIAQWIKEGARNTTICQNSCDSTLSTFSKGVSPILQTNCTGCHNAANASGSIRLDTYAGARAAAVSNKLLGSVQHKPGFIQMPQGGAKLSDCAVKIIQNWVVAGTPNN